MAEHGYRMKRYDSYKDSGVEWLGEVPACWARARLKDIVDNVTERADGENGSIPYIGLENIQSWTGQFVSSDGPATPDGTANTFASSDLLFGKLRPYLAKAFKAEYDGRCSTELLVLRPKKVARGFLFYHCLTDRFIRIVDSSTYGAKMPRANWDFIGNLPRPAWWPMPEKRPSFAKR